MTLRLRRGTDLQRQGLVLAEGELVYVTDTKEIYAGDGSTLGGIKVTGDVLGSPPRLTQNLDLDGYNIAGLGTISATAFIGDGSQLTGIASSGGGIIEGQEYQIDIVGDVKASNSTVLVDSSTSSFFGNFVGDGSLLSDLELNQNTDVNILLPTDGDILQYTGGIWVNTPLAINIVEGTDYRFNIIGDDSTKIVDTATGNVTGNFIGDGSLITNLELNQNTDVNILSPAEGDILQYIGGDWINSPLTINIVDGSDYRLNIIGADSSTIVDTATNTLSGNLVSDTISYEEFITISNTNSGQIGQVTLSNTGAAQQLQFIRTDTGTAPDQTIGYISFEQEDDGGIVTYSSMGFWHSGIYIGHSTTGVFDSSKYLGVQDGGLSIGNFSPAAGYNLDVNGDSIFRGIADFEQYIKVGNYTEVERDALSGILSGTTIFNSTTNGLAFYDGTEWNNLISADATLSITSIPGAMILTGITSATRDGYGSDSVDITGAVIYNSTTDRFEFFQAGSWVTLHNNGTSAGQVLTWDGTKWEATAPATGGSVVSADQLDGFDGPYYLDWTNFTSTPTTLAGYGIADAVLATELGNFTFTGSVLDTDDSSAVTVTPAVTFSSDVTVQNSLTVTNKITVDTLEVSNLITTELGNFTFAGSVLDTDDSSAVTVTPATVFSSDVTVQNNLTVTNKITVDTLEVANLITAPTAGTPEISSDGAILLTAATRVEISSSPLKMASFTTAERDVLSAENGDMIYNTSTNKFQGYANGIWVDLH